ncbi:MAG: sigma-70 family RNA polymerase sigma factor [Gemmataceae bacterium]
MKSPPATKSQRRPVLMAMVLGTALTTLGSPANAAPALSDAATQQAITAISKYCTVCWRNARLHPDCWTDCTQEVFSRLLERLPPDAWSLALRHEGDERKELQRAVDAVKKRTQRARQWGANGIETYADRQDNHRRQVAEDLALVRQVAEQRLSPRQQRILALSFDGWSVQDIAAELRTPPERVSDEKYKAIRKLQEELAERN